MQGRLSPQIKNKIQAFPFNSWKKEFEIAKNINFNLLEWTVDSYKYLDNPLVNKKKLNQIKKCKKKYSMNINSVTCDFLMEHPFFFKKNN